MTDWVRLWHDMPTDPKWRVIARKSGQPLACVVAIFTLMMTEASAADDRGSIERMSIEDAAAALDMDDAAVAAILSAMEGRVISSGRLTGWERRQPRREDGSAERAALWREQKKAEQKQHELTQTQTNAQERPEKRREDKIIPSSLHSDGSAPEVLEKQGFAEPETVQPSQPIAKQKTKPAPKPSVARAMPDRWPDGPEAYNVFEDMVAKGEADWAAFDRLMAEFGDYHEAKGSRFVSWAAALRTWVRNDRKFKSRQDSRPFDRSQAFQRH